MFSQARAASAPTFRAQATIKGSIRQDITVVTAHTIRAQATGHNPGAILWRKPLPLRPNYYATPTAPDSLRLPTTTHDSLLISTTRQCAHLLWQPWQ